MHQIIKSEKYSLIHDSKVFYSQVGASSRSMMDFCQGERKGSESRHPFLYYTYSRFVKSSYFISRASFILLFSPLVKQIGTPTSTYVPYLDRRYFWKRALFSAVMKNPLSISIFPLNY